jgi:hypothetical protein
MVPRSVRNWIAVNAVQQFSLNKKMKRKQRMIVPISNPQATIRCLTRRQFLGTGLVAGIGAVALTPRIASSLQARETEALIGQWPAGFYKGMCYSAFPSPYDPSHANRTCIFFGSNIAYNPMEPLWGRGYMSAGHAIPGRDDLRTMKTMGVTLVRLYDWEPRNLPLNFLEYCNQLGMKVLAPVSNYFLIRGQGFENRKTLIPALIRSYRNAAGSDYHPAIAGIIMGNEPYIATPTYLARLRPRNSRKIGYALSRTSFPASVCRLSAIQSISASTATNVFPNGISGQTCWQD